MFSRGLSKHITFHIVPLLPYRGLEVTAGHPDVLTLGIVGTVLLKTPPVENTVVCFRVYRS